MEFIRSGNSLLQDAADPDTPHSCNANWYRKHLQVPFTENCGAVIGMFHNCNTGNFQKILELGIASLCELDNLDPIPIAVRLKQPRAPPTSSATASKKKTFKDNERMFHVEVPRGTAKRLFGYIYKIIKHSRKLVGHTNMRLSWLPEVNKTSTPSEVHTYKEGLAYQKNLVNSVNFQYVPGVIDLNITSRRLGGRSLRSLILELKLPSNPDREAFVHVETGYSGEALVYYTKAWEDEAKLLIKFLLIYLRRNYPDAGDAVDKGFSQEAIELANTYIWDPETDQPISEEHLAIQNQLADIKATTSDWLIENMDLLQDAEKDKALQHPAKNLPAWDTTSYKSAKPPDAPDDASDADSTIAASVSPTSDKDDESTA